MTPLLTLQQLRLMRQLSVCWLIGCGGKSVRAARVSNGRYRTSLGRFLDKSSWDVPAIVTMSVVRILRSLQPRAGEWIWLVIDDTRISGRGWRWMCIAAVNGRLSKIGTVRVVSTKRPRERWKNMLAIVTNATEMSARTVIANHERHWAIEVLSKELQGTFGLGECQVQKRQGTLPHLHVCGLAHLGLTHHALRAAGAEAKHEQGRSAASIPRTA